MKRSTLVRKLTEQLGESGYFVRMPSPVTKVMYVGLPGTDVTVRAVRLALEPNVLEVLDNGHMVVQSVQLVPAGAIINPSPNTLVKISLAGGE